MQRQDNYGFINDPVNGLGIIRARTMLGNLRIWDIPRSEQALDMIVDEIGRSPIPGVYMLFDERSGKKVYVGQTENIRGRLTNHIDLPEEKIKNWERAMIINDARNATYSDINDENIRLSAYFGEIAHQNGVIRTLRGEMCWWNNCTSSVRIRPYCS